MKINTLGRSLVGVVALLLVPSMAMAGSATDWVKVTVGEMRNALAEQAPGESLSREKLMEVSRFIDGRFDFSEMARLALGQHWQQRSPEEQQEFVGLFRNLLQRSHFLSMTNKAKSEQHFVGERTEGDRTIVQAMVTAEDSEVPIDYVLLRHNGAWKICDLGIDGMRLSEIYRAQFNRVISTASYDELVRRMQIKLQEVAYEARAIR
ncbi:MAG: phospholipid-binding protein MlaC [Candidatus Methylomirabilales bacterium]